MANDIRIKCDKVIEDWKQIGGFINCLEYGTPIFIEDESVYFDWLKRESLLDTPKNQKEFCMSALKMCKAYSDDEIKELLAFWEV